MPLYMYVWEMNLKECVNVHYMTNNPHDTCIFLGLPDDIPERWKVRTDTLLTHTQCRWLL